MLLWKPGIYRWGTNRSVRRSEHRAAIQIVNVLPTGNKLSQQVVAEWLPQGAGCQVATLPHPHESVNPINCTPVQNKQLKLIHVEPKQKRPLQASQTRAFASPTNGFCTADATMFSPKWLFLRVSKEYTTLANYEFAYVRNLQCMTKPSLILQSRPIHRTTRD